MPHLWFSEQTNWNILSLDKGRKFVLTGDPSHPVGKEDQGDKGVAVVITQENTEGKKGTWVLVAPANKPVRVNGESLARLMVRVLQDRDEIRIAGHGSLFFSTECLATIEPFPGADRPVFCPRCKQEVTKNAMAVCCPQCKSWHHQSADFPCWTYSPKCAVCNQTTALDAGYRWTPEEL